MDDAQNRIKIVEAITRLAQLMASMRPATERETAKRTKADRDRLAKINGQKRGRL